MVSLPTALHSVAEVRALDRHAIDELGIPGYALMTRAGEAGLAVLRSAWPTAARILVACGRGNNAGDGYVLARLAQAERLDCTVLACGDPTRLKGDALTAYQDYVLAGGSVSQTIDALHPRPDVIVDALFGTGLNRDLEAGWRRWIEALNAAGPPILALDVPSGLDADTGRVCGAAIRAERTVVFVGLKIGLYLGAGPDCTGTVVFDDLGLAPTTSGQVGRVATRIDSPFLTTALPARRRAANKGEYGQVLLIAGGLGMAGAARLAGEACLRCGAGRVTVATRTANIAAITSGRPELMTRGVEDGQDLAPLLKQIDLIAIGPGLGQDAWAQAVFAMAVAAGKPMVVDADALNLLALAPCRRDDWILTPHPGEAGRLLNLTAAAVQSDRLGAAAALVERYGGIAVLKGAGTLVLRQGDLPHLCNYGNPGMASPGMGDVLTGVIAGLAVQMPDLWMAARAGVLVHALAGDAAARRGERGLLASDLFGASARFRQSRAMKLLLPTAAATRALGEQLGRALATAGRLPQVIALNGELGAGKTTFVAGVLAGLGIAVPVRSPTYTLIEPYEARGRALYHLDLYRLSGPGDLDALGLADLHDNDSTLLIEWAERGGGALPPIDLTLQFAYGAGDPALTGDALRELSVSAHSAVGEQLAAALAQPL